MIRNRKKYKLPFDALPPKKFGEGQLHPGQGQGLLHPGQDLVDWIITNPGQIGLIVTNQS